MALGFAAADLTLGAESRLEFVLLVGGVLILPFVVMVGVRRGVTTKTTNATEAWIFRIGGVFAGAAGLWLMAWGESLIPWWIVVAPAAVAQWIFIWLKVGPEPSPENIARVFD